MYAGKAVFMRKLIALKALLEKEEMFKIDDLSYRLKKLEEEEKIKPRINRRKELNKEISEL